MNISFFKESFSIVEWKKKKKKKKEKKKIHSQQSQVTV